MSLSDEHGEHPLAPQTPQILKGPNIDDWEMIERTPAAEMNQRYGPDSNKRNLQKFGNQYGASLNLPITGFEKLRKQNIQLK